MGKPAVYFIVSLKIHEGKLDAFKQIAQAMIAVTQNEPGTLAYEWHFSADGARCRLLEAYADQGAVLSHMNGPAVRDFVPKLIQVCSVTGFEVYGDPGTIATATLMAFGAEVFPRWQGLER